ncbi:MAG: YdcF family protein [Desulfobacterales bacterium]|nr:YdcF family protein [Desulfobacterales bacterium]
MDTVFFWASKLVWLVVRPDFLLVFFTLAGVFCLFAGAVKRAKLILSAVVLFMVAVTVLPMGQWLLSPLENRFPTNPELPENVDGIIVLAGAENAYRSAVWDQVELWDHSERLYYFMKFMRIYPDAAYLFAGDSGTLYRQEYKAADLARKMFGELGFDADKILFERESKNTYENGVNAYNLVKPEPDEKWILITTAWHMPRAVGVFENLGWDVIPFPVDHGTDITGDDRFFLTWEFTGNMKGLQTGIKEWVGLTAYYLTGRTSVLFPPVSP